MCDCFYGIYIYVCEKINEYNNLLLKYYLIDEELDEKNHNNYYFTNKQCFEYILCCIEGNEIKHIPSNLINKLILLGFKENYSIIRYLNNNNYSEYTNHLSLIKRKLNFNIIKFDVELKHKLISAYSEINTITDVECVNAVKNMNYFYIAYKLCELMDKKEYLDNIYISPKISYNLDPHWKNICEQLNWEYIQTDKVYFDGNDDIDWELVLLSV